MLERRQQYLILKQPCGGKIKHQTGALITQPGAGIQQAFQAERPREIAKFMIGIMFFNERGMLSAGSVPFKIAREYFRAEDMKLHGDKSLNAWQDLG